MGGGDDIYFDNKDRRLYFIQPNINSNTDSFAQSDIDKEKEK